MPASTWTAPSRRALLTFDEAEAEAERRRALGLTTAVAPEDHAANARFADAILGTGNYDDAARTALSDLSGRGEPAAQSLRDLVDQLHERDPEVAAAFAGSVRRLAEQSVSERQMGPRPEPRSPSSETRRNVGHLLFPGQVPIENENPWAEAAADAIPFLGNVRSASQAARDVEEAIAAFRQGDYWATAGHGAMAMIDGLGAVPGAGNLLAVAKPAIRNAVRATPGLRRAHGSWTLAKAARQFDNPISVSPEKLYGEFWPKLSARQQKKLKGLQPLITGKGGEGYHDELLTSSGFHHQGDGKVQWGNPTGRPRIFDAETAERFETILFGLFAVPKQGPGSRNLFELKVAGGKLGDIQKKADDLISQSETIQYLIPTALSADL